MGVSFSQSGVAAAPMASVPSPRHATQRPSGLSSPSPPTAVTSGLHGDTAALYTASQRESDFASVRDAAFPPATITRPATALTGKSTASTAGLNSGAVAQQIQQSLSTLSLDWAVIDREVGLVTIRFAASLLTSRLRVQRSNGGGVRAAEDEEAAGGSVRASTSMGVCDAPANIDASAFHADDAQGEEDVGPQELYVSAVLRLAALQLGPDGLQRIVAALAFLANGGESREERRLRRQTSLPTNTSAMRRVESSLQEINHFQRGAGFTGSANAMALPGSATHNLAGGAAGSVGSGGANVFSASGSALPSLTNSTGGFAGRRFSTAPHSQVQQVSANMYLANSSGSAAAAAAAMHTNAVGNASTDNMAFGSPVRGAGNSSITAGHGGGHPQMLRQPSSGRSLDEAACLLGASNFFHRHRSVSPLNATAAHLHFGSGHSLRPHRHSAENDVLHEDYSYNNMLLTSMNARSTLLSPVRTGLHGEPLYSNSSLATLMSLSTGVGAWSGGRSHRGGAGHDGLHSPVSPFLHPTTQWVIPPAPLGAQLVSSNGGMASANSSIPNSLSSAASPPSAPESRRRSEIYSRRLVQPLSTYQISRLSAAGAGAMLSRPASEDASLNALLYHLPPAVGGLVGVDAFGSACVGDINSGGGGAAAPPLAPGLRDTALQLLRPEAVLTALCCVFAHLHLTSDDVVNLVTLLVVAALEVQTDAQLRRLVEAEEDLTAESLRAPSMKQVRAAVQEALAPLLIPLYRRTRLSLCAAAGAMDGTIQSALLASTTGREGDAGGPVSQRLSPLRPGTHAADFHSSVVPLPPVAPPTALTQQQQQRGERHRSHPHSPLPGTPIRSNDEDTESGAPARCLLSEADLSIHARALHDFFESCVPLESTPSPWSATSTAAAARAMATRRAPASAQRGSGSRQPPPHQLVTKTASVGGYAFSSLSDSAAGPTSSGSMSRSDVTDAVANLMSGFPARTDSAFTPPLQEEVRLANNLLMDVETAFVLHYAEVVPDAEASRRRLVHTAAGATAHTPAAASSLPSSPSSPSQRLRQRTGSLGKRPTLHTPSTPTAPPTTTAHAGAAAAASSVKGYPWRRRSDADPDLFVQLNSNATVWPLRTRLLVRRHEYAYVYDAMASTMALLREENLYCSGDGVATEQQQQQPHASRVPHPHTPIALIDLSAAGVEKGLNDLQVLSGPGDVEVVSLMPSRVCRSSLVSHTRRASSTGGSGSATTASASQTSTPNSASFSGPPPPPSAAAAAAAIGGEHGGNSSVRGAHTFDDLLSCCWADAYQHDMEVYRMKGSTGTMYLLTVPAEADRGMVPAAATASTITTTVPPADEAARSSVIHSFERNRLVRPAVLSLSPSTAAGREAEGRGGGGGVNSSNSSRHGEEASRAAAGKGPRVQCAYNDGSREVLSLELGSEPTRIAAYPLRLLYRGVLHHFFFPNPSARDHWYQQLLQLSWMTQSKAYRDTVAAAPHDVERFIHNRISFPTGPGAFECLDMLGAGTFGRVLLVQHKLSKRLFAMKVIRKSGFHGIRNIIEARREKKILDQLDCPYIMKIHSHFQTDSRVYMVLDYLPGAELLLHTQSAHSNHFDETTSRFYIAELAIAVEYLRVRGIVHRDIKGDNLVLDAEGHVVLTDFGFAKNIVSSHAAAATGSDPAAPPQVIRQHTSCGTLAYIAPEVLCNSRRRSGYGLAVDWWSLGVVLFTFLTGYFPFLKQTGPETSQAIVSSPLQFPPRPALSEEARSLLEQLLQKDPDKRTTCLADLRHHRFFEGFDWAACKERRLPPPLVLHKDSYRSPRTTADARQLLQDRVRRSLAWSSGQSDQQYVAPSHSRRSTSDKLSIKHQPQLAEEQAELKLVERAYGSDCMPKPLSSFNDVFGPLFEQQERCGSDRDESDVEELGMEDYVAPLARPTVEALRRLRDCEASQDFASSFSDMSLTSTGADLSYVNGSAEERAGAASRQGKALAMPTLPALVDFSEDLYADVALAKYHAAAAAA